MQIKSLDELRKIREEQSGRINLRDYGEVTGDKVEILIGMATCGISAGARETLNEFMEQINKQKLNKVKVVSVGCIGYCHAEPTVQVNIPGQKPVLYGGIKKDKVSEILESHVKGGKPVESLRINIDFERP